MKLRNVLTATITGAVLSAVFQVPASAATTLYVATNGNDANAGTQAAPFATIQKAISLITPGGTIAVRGGTYALSSNIQITRSGTSSAPITLTAYGSERVIIDGEALGYTPGAVGSTIPAAQRGAIHMEASYWKLAGLEIINGPYGVYCAGCNNNTFERLVTRDNYETGFQLQNSSANNLILNLDSYGNRDPRKNGESADGLGIKEGSGDGNATAVALGSSTASGNSWNIAGTWTLTSTDASTITGARAADGAIRPSSFLVPSDGASVGAEI
ncbi:hypothetical protein Aph02nite_67290 [Actinoplanes philippinensis]|uniref:DUF1565 domain-containing protein n=1 Tax=Actinoplanes philippinensis TaxID=35752 RepID=A0A1I2KYS6_9ACTN|nr:DUF1565 domain-containing protein [Actinoplanes philippinensis]GIE80779.1 hypothetical protein Aph02nite_67290 [Actinoplanes philippinensis]SFF71723.1 Protein of unknown function [Actinoplanes philippinensis]